MDFKSFIGNPTRIEDLEVAQFDYPEKLNFKDAITICTQVGNGWRLPSKKELNLIYKNKDNLGCEIFKAYYSSVLDKDGWAWYKWFGSGNWTNCLPTHLMDIRLVRTIK